MKIFIPFLLLCLHFFNNLFCQVNKSDSINCFKSNHYEIFFQSSIDSKELKYTKKIINSCINKYKKILDEKPPYIAVLIFSSPQGMQSFDYNQLINRNIYFIHFFSIPNIEKFMIKIKTIEDLGIVLSQVPTGPIIVSAIIPPTSAINVDFKNQDIIKEMNQVSYNNLDSLIADYLSYSEGAAVGFNLEREKEKCSILIKKPKQNKSFVKSTKDNKVKIIKEITTKYKILSHEIGHIYLEAYADRLSGIKKWTNHTNTKHGNHYGHPKIPDWFDEAFAILFETKKLKETRWRNVKKERDNFIPLKDLFNINRTEINKGENNEIYQDHKHDSLLIENKKSFSYSVTAGIDIKNDDNNDTTAVYYDQVLTVIEFLIAKEGKPIIKKMINGFLEKKSIERILKENAKVLPSDLSDLEDVWSKWVDK